ncbi:MAG: hypothetical protein WCT04_08305 [Planctomycetota bacterium]
MAQPRESDLLNDLRLRSLNISTNMMRISLYVLKSTARVNSQENSYEAERAAKHGVYRAHIMPVEFAAGNE